MFLALWPPEAVLDEVDRALPRDFTALKWQARERWHITVAFLGDRDSSKEQHRLQEVRVRQLEPMRLSGSGSFGPVLWVGVQTGPWVAELAGDTRRVFKVDERRFRAHVTVARARDAVGRRQLPQAQSALAGFTSQEWRPDALTLVRSTIGPRPTYEVIGRRDFLGP